MKLSFAILLCLCTSLAHAETFSFSVSGTPSANPNVTVQDDSGQRTISDAQVSVADRDGSKVVTVSKEGYATVTIYGVRASQVTVFLHKLPASAPQAIASGTMTGFPEDLSREAESSRIKAGVVFPKLGVSDLLSFDTGAFISPLKDTIDVFGPHEIPSNIVLPEQSIFPITLNKPDYRMPLEPGRETRLVGIQGWISSGDIQSAGKASFALLNKMNFVGFGVGEQVTPSSDFRQNIDASTRVEPLTQVSVENPPFAADVITCSVSDLQGDRQILIPTDIKAPITQDQGENNNPVSLLGASAGFGRARDVVTIAVADKGRKLTGIFSEAKGSMVKPGPYLPVQDLASSPQLPASVRIRAPEHGIGALIFSANTNGDGHRIHPVAFVYILPGAGEVEVPSGSIATRETIRQYSVTNLDFGSSFNEQSIDGRNIMTRLERFSRASAQIGN